MTDFDPTKPVQTRDGRKARIICTDAKGEYPIVALITYEDGEEEPGMFYSNGAFISGQHTLPSRDLVNIPQEPQQ